MRDEPVISSLQNPKVKRLLLLQQKSQQRRDEGVFVVEGRRELQHCIEAGYEVESIFSLTPSREGNCYTVTPKVYEKIAYRGSTV